eukprot:6857150-Pyramimonas_sp.AAC.1
MKSLCEETAFVKTHASKWSARTDFMLAPMADFPEHTRMRIPCDPLFCQADLSDEFKAAMREHCKLLEALVAPRGLKVKLDRLRLLCFRKDDTNVFVLTATARKAPFMAEFCLCRGPQGPLVPPYRVSLGFRDFHAKPILDIVTEYQLCK